MQRLSSEIQAEVHLLHQMNYIASWSSVSKWSLNHSTGIVDWMSGSANDYPSQLIASAQKEWLDLGWLRVHGHWTGKTWHLPPLKGTMSQHMETCGPSWGYCVWGIGEVLMGWKGRLTKLRVDMCCKCFWVFVVKLGYQSFWAFDIFSQSPFIFFDPISLPAYQVSNQPLNIWLSNICSTLYSSTPLWTMGEGGSHCMCLVIVSVYRASVKVTEKTGGFGQRMGVVWGDMHSMIWLFQPNMDWATCDPVSLSVRLLLCSDHQAIPYPQSCTVVLLYDGCHRIGPCHQLLVSGLNILRLWPFPSWRWSPFKVSRQDSINGSTPSRGCCLVLSMKGEDHVEAWTQSL